MKRKIFIYTFILFLILISITLGVVLAVNRNNSEDDKLTSKVEEEIKMLEEKIISMMNRLNNISFLNNSLIEEETKSSDNSNEQNNEEGSNEQSEQSSSSGSSKENEESKDSKNAKDSIKYELVNKGILSNNKSTRIDWDNIKVDLEAIHTILPTVIADLNGLDVENEEILNFGISLDNVTISIKNEDKTASLNNLAKLYAFLPSYKSKISKDMISNNISYCKNSILNSYALIEQNNWQEVQNELTNAISFYSNVMDSIDENIQNKNNINKIFILLNELNNSIKFQDKDLFYIKYRNVMEELVNF